VDDFSDRRQVLAEYLKLRGFPVASAQNAATALEIARRRVPRILLMDVTMRGVEGWETARQLKADPRTKAVIVIALTRDALEPDEAIALQAGCDGYVRKPYELAVLGDALVKVMRRGRSALKAVSGCHAIPHQARSSPQRGRDIGPSSAVVCFQSVSSTDVYCVSTAPIEPGVR